MRTITLTASARYGYGGKQYIARITGRDSKFTFAREFVGTKSGKRRDHSEYQTDEPGLYVTCDLDSKGRKDETYWLIEDDGQDGVKSSTCDREEAMQLAKMLDAGTSFADAVARMWPPKTREQVLREYLAEAEPKDQDFAITKPSALALSLLQGEAPTTRGRLVELARAELAAITEPVEIFDPCL